MSRRARSAAFWSALVGSLILVALASGPGARDGAPLDPESTGRDGTKALVMLLRELGANPQVTRAGPGPGQSTALLLTDQVDNGLAEWVEQGGVLLVADPSSSLSPAAVGEAQADVDIRRTCPMPAFGGIKRISVDSAVGLGTPSGAVGCFPLQGGHFMVVIPRGEGRIVALGGPLVLINSALGRADNAALVAAVLAPTPGTQVAIVTRVPAGGGRKGLLDLIDPRVRSGVVQLLVAFGVVVLWRSRRLGRPVSEDVPVDVSGSEMVVAVGRLLQQGRHRSRAAEILQADLSRLIDDRMPSRSGLDPALIATAFSPDPSTDEDLIAVANAIESVRQEVVHAR